MANVIIKSPERVAFENKIARDFGHDPSRMSAAHREQAEAVAARSMEAHRELKRMEERYR